MSKHLPDYMSEDLFTIDYRKLHEAGVRGIAVDIDNTLVPMHRAHADERARKWAYDMKKMGFSVVILSNASRKRTEAFMKDMGVLGIWLSGKPLPGAYLRAAAMMGLDPGNCAMIGDQLFTDIRGGKKAGFFTILTRPLDTREILFVRLKRLLERPFLKKHGERIQRI
ncbi:MAG: YqeG family HAD IIIA-type phosphatase [Clostridia bacterium]